MFHKPEHSQAKPQPHAHPSGAFYVIGCSCHAKKALPGNKNTRLSDRRLTPALRHRLPVSFLCILMSNIRESHRSMSRFPN